MCLIISGSRSAATTFPRGTDLANLKLKYPDPAPRSNTVSFPRSPSAVTTSLGFLPRGAVRAVEKRDVFFHLGKRTQTLRIHSRLAERTIHPRQVVIVPCLLAGSRGRLRLRLAAGSNCQPAQAHQPEHFCAHSRIQVMCPNSCLRQLQIDHRPQCRLPGLQRTSRFASLRTHRTLGCTA